MLAIQLDPAAVSDTARLLELREEAAAWLVQRGIRQWQPGEVGAEEIGAQIHAGEWAVHRRDGTIQGALRLLLADPAFWGERPDDAAYVHGLVIDRHMAGQGLGGGLLDWAERRTRSVGRSFLRLDCSETNERLRSYYRDRGFADVGRRDPGHGRWAVTLFEKPV